MSEGLRRKGNERYKSAMIEGLNKKTKKDKLLDAVKLYQQAYSSGRNADEQASAAKNLGTAAYRLAPLVKEMGENKYIEHYHYKEAIKHLSLARRHGKVTMSYEWQTGVYESLQECIECAQDSDTDLTYRNRIGYMEEYINCMLDEEIQAQCFIRIAEDLFKNAITNMTTSGYKTALNDLRECHRPIQEARRLGGAQDTSVGMSIQSNANVLEQDCFLHLCIAESIQAREIGDGLLAKELQDEENINMSMILDIIDWYKKAIIQTRENDVEQEAIALSRLGYVYEKVRKNKPKAHDNYHRCVQLAMSMHPRTFHTEEWFKKATVFLQKYQEEIQKQEDVEWNKAREKFVKELEKELEELKKQFNKGDLNYIQFIYKTHAPKRDDHKLGDTKTQTLKSLFKTALIHYHPDKQKVHGEKWMVMCEEICKLLTQRYELYKGD